MHAGIRGALIAGVMLGPAPASAAPASAAPTLAGHPVVLDGRGKLLSWVDPQDQAYGTTR